MRPIEIFIQGEGFADIVVAKAEAHRTVAELLANLDRPVSTAEDLFVFIEDVGAPLDAEVVLEELLPLVLDDETIDVSLRLHIARCRHVEVQIRFNGELVKRRFPPSATIARVHHWAARRAFHLAPRDAAEHVLQLLGSNARPDRDVHVGTLVAERACEVSFDLVPRKRVEGCA